ncbi:MAG: transglycosylase SLT domain-containing protein, partial [Gemmatimonadales bacterium]
MARRPLVFVLALALLAACGGGQPAPKTAPAPRQKAQTQALRDTAPAKLPTPEIPAAPDFDSTVPPQELLAERQLASDSAADQAVLEALADAAPSVDEAEDAARGIDPGAKWDIDVATYNSHDRVKYYLDFFRGPARERFGIWLTRMPRYEPMIRERLQKEGLPADLVYLALIESGFSNSATSRARAVGMWQFMKGTAKLYGLRVDSWVDERRDPYRATDAAARHLRDLTKRFGSLYLAAAAYNAGAGKVSRGLGRLPEDDADSVNSDATFFRLYDTKLL